MRELAVTELRTTLSAMFDQLGDSHRVVVIRDGEPALAIALPDVAACGLAFVARFAGLLTLADLAAVMEADRG